MEKTWRWFGRNDIITLEMLRQIGVEGIVSALHGIPNGQVWQPEQIAEYKAFIESAGLRWSVVESLPVSESIKYGGPDRDQLIENYKISLKNLGQAGIHTVCYNFMPVIDWIRTDLHRRLPDGTCTLYFDKIRFAYFDCCILNRKGAEADYSEEELAKVHDLKKTITRKEIDELIDTIIVKTQGFINGNISGKELDPVAVFNGLLARYGGIDKNALRENMKFFLEQVTPVATEYGVNLCVHPDDPPCQVLGLPRIVTSAEDIEWILNAVDEHANGLTFCAGSLSSGAHNNVPAMAERFATRTHFVHLRSTDVLPGGDFVEASHLAGRAGLIDVVRIFLAEEKRRRAAGMFDSRIPMRVDHGPLMLDDLDKSGFNPGYSFLGRMKALAEMSGVMAAVEHCEK